MKDRYLITQSLLSAWDYLYKLDNGYEEFLKTLMREKTPPNKAMLDGQKFENVVNSVLDGATITEQDEFYEPIMKVLYPLLVGSQKQVKVYKDVSIGEDDFLLYGILDFLKAGTIYDTKFSKSYHVGKYLTSPQHPMYFELVPKAFKFEYLICDGNYVYRERYFPYEVESIYLKIDRFKRFLKGCGLWDLFRENWRSK